MVKGGNRRGAGRPRKIVQEMVNQPHVVHTPYPFKTTGRKRGRPRKTSQKTANATDEDTSPKTTGRKRGRPRKTPQQTVNATDDDTNPSFPENSIQRGEQVTRAEDDELNSFSKELSTEQDSSDDTTDEDTSDTSDEDYAPYFSKSTRKRGRRITQDESDELNSSSSEELSTDGRSQHVQNAGVACNHPLPSNLVMSVTGENVNSSQLATPIDENPIKTEDDLCFPTKGKGVAAEPTSETILQGNNVSGHLGENIAKINTSVSSDPSKSKCGSSILRPKRSKDAPMVPMDSCVNDNHLLQTQVNIVAKDARTITCQSINLTEVAGKFNNTLIDNDDDDGKDIQSAIDPSLVVVKGYRVKPEIAPLLNQIFEQHGDIAKDCKEKGLKGCFLEIVCSVYDKLQNSSFQKIKRAELFEMGETLDGLERMGLNVKWLSVRLYKILDVRVFLKVYGQKIKEFKKGKDRLIYLENEAASIRENLSVLETDISTMKGEEEKVQTAHNLLNNSLVDGLI